MSLSDETATRLFREGEFPQLIQASGSTEKSRRTLQPHSRVIVANALAFLGQLDEARRLAELDLDQSSTLAVRSQAESTLALVHWR